ncbi:hypothetical protein N7445_004247 [Penicillium cf. griseofulvum]|nr:hypothetical protein N7445_004247 [Penicillium cf. griseofulvum]
MSGRLRNLGEIHGFLQSMFAYRFRYGGGKMLNESSAVSEAQQNLIMKHADTRTFLNHYLPRYIDTDMQNVMNGRESNKSLMRAITRMKYVEATRRMKEQAEECKCDPSAAMQSRLAKLTRETSNTFGRLERALRRKVRHKFDRKQAIIDIKRQLSGAAVDNEEAKKVLQVED